MTTGLVVTDPPRVAPKVAVVVQRLAAGDVQRGSAEREPKEAGVRARLHAGEVGQDIYGTWEELAAKGLTHRPQAGN